MRVEILYFDGCPSYLVAEERLRQILLACAIAADLELLPVETVEEARRLRFPGSPTIRIDGVDLFPIEEQADATLSCRIYRTPEGLAGSPTHAMIAEALGRVAAQPAARL